MAGPADEIIVRLTADASGIAAGTQAAADSVAEMQAQIDDANAAAGESAAAGASAFADAWGSATVGVRAAMGALQEQMVTLNGESLAAANASQLLGDVAAGTAADFDGLVAQEQQLIEAMQTGTISAEEYGGAMDALDAQTATLTGASEAAASAQAELIAAQDAQLARWMAQAAAIAANTGELNANTAAQEENAAAGGGGGGRPVYGLFSLVMRAGHALATPVGALGAALVAMGVDAAIAQSHIDDLTNAVAATGGATGESAGQILAWADQVGGSVSTIDIAESAFQQLAMSGEFVGTQLKDAGDAAVTMAQLTGESTSQAANAIEKMVRSGAGVDELNAKFHFLTAAQKATIDAEYAAGHAASGESQALADLAAQLDKTAHSVGSLQGAWDAFKNGLESTGTGLAVGFGGGTDSQQLAFWKNQLAHHVHETYSEGGLSADPGRKAIEANIAHYQALVDAHKKQAQLQEIVGNINAGVVSGYGKRGLAADEHYIAMEESIKNMSPAAAHTYAHQFWEHIRKIAPAASAEGMYAYRELSTGMGRGAAAHYVAPPGSIETATPGVMGSFDTGMMTREAHRIAVEHHAQAVADQVHKLGMESQAAHHVAMLDTQRQHIQAMVSMGTMGGATAIAQAQSIADRIYQIKLAELEKEKALEATKPVEVARINSEIVRLQDSHAATLQTLADKTSAQQIKTAEAVVAPITQTFSQITAGYVEGTLTRQQAELRLGDALVAETINTGVQMLMHHIAIEEAKTLATAVGTAERLALTIASEAEAAAIHVAHAIAYIATEAAKAAAAAFSAVAGIPVIGPILAVAASVAAGAEVLNLVGKVASAEGGWERVPFDNAPALLHKDEMVLPADLADGVRNMSGGGGNTYHYHIHANDAAGFEGMLKRNPAALVRALGHAHRIGATA